MVKLQQFIIYEHTKGFIKALRQVEFLYEEVSSKNARFDVNKDIYECRMLDVDDIVVAKVVGKMIITEDVLFEEETNDGSDETYRVSPSIATNPFIKDEEMFNT